jgi:hypothetical protein
MANPRWWRTAQSWNAIPSWDAISLTLNCGLAGLYNTFLGSAMPRRHLLRLERKGDPLLSRRAFAGRIAASLGVATVFIALSLLAGMAGYHYLEEMQWIDAYANASMILSGMGPLDPPKTYGGKLFAGTYALYSGLAVILAAGILITPVVHRMLHQFHLDDEEDREHRKHSGKSE